VFRDFQTVRVFLPQKYRVPLNPPTEPNLIRFRQTSRFKGHHKPPDTHRNPLLEKNSNVNTSLQNQHELWCYLQYSRLPKRSVAAHSELWVGVAVIPPTHVTDKNPLSPALFA
jgi:hypothetical protein